MVAKTACDLMAYDFCSVTLPDEGSHVLLIQGSHGLSEEYIQDVNAKHPILLHGASLPSPSSQSFSLGIPIQIEDTATSPSFRPWAGVARNQGFTSMIAVPLTSSGQTLGTINCYTRTPHHFTKEEESLLGVLADQAAIAIVTTRLRAEQSTTITSLNSLNETLAEQHELHRRVAEIHDRLTALALAGGGVAEVGTALAELLGQTVVIRHGHDTHVCGSSPGTESNIEALVKEANRLEPEDSASRKRSLEAVITSTSDGTAFTAVRAPVVVRNDVVAWILTTGNLDDLEPVNLRAIEHAATVLALELLSVRTASEAAWRHSGDILSGLLRGAGNDPRPLVAQARKFGHDLSQPHAVILLGDDSVHDEAFQLTLFDVFEQLILDKTPQPLVGLHENYIVVLWPLVDPVLQPAFDISEEIRRSLGRSVANPGRVLAVVTGPVTDPAKYPEAFSIARGAAALANLRGVAGRSLVVEGTGIAGILLQVPDASRLHSFCEAALAPLRPTDLLPTLSTLVRNNLDAAATAEQLLVPGTMIIQRRQRIEELLGEELTSVEALTRLATALRVEDIFAPRQTQQTTDQPDPT